MKLLFYGQKIKIRELNLSDAFNIYKNAKDKDVAKWTRSLPHPYTKKHAINFVKKSQANIKKRKAYVFGISYANNDNVIGVISLFGLNWKGRSAGLGYWVGKKYWNKGIMKEAVKLILKFGFDKLKLNKISACVYEGNTASRRILKKHGFKWIGYSKNSTRRFGKILSEYHFALLKTNYRKR